MHELGVLYHMVRMVNALVEEHHIQQVKYITLDVGEDSGFVPAFLEKLFPVAADSFPVIKQAELRINNIPGKSFLIKDIGY